MTDRIPLIGSHLASDDPLLGPAPQSAMMTVTVVVRGQAPLPASPVPGTGPALSRAAFDAAYGMSDEDLAAVRAYAQAQGLVVGTINHPARTVQLTGTVQQIESAFGVSMMLYRGPDGTSYRANDADGSLPATIAASVEFVLGLSDRPAAQPRRGPASRAAPATPAR